MDSQQLCLLSNRAAFGAWSLKCAETAHFRGLTDRRLDRVLQEAHEHGRHVLVHQALQDHEVVLRAWDTVRLHTPGSSAPHHLADGTGQAAAMEHAWMLSRDGTGGSTSWYTHLSQMQALELTCKGWNREQHLLVFDDLAARGVLELQDHMQQDVGPAALEQEGDLPPYAAPCTHAHTSTESTWEALQASSPRLKTIQTRPDDHATLIDMQHCINSQAPYDGCT